MNHCCIRRLIEEATGVLERIGTVTPHRNGLSVLYGKHLQHLLQTSGPPKPNRPPKPRRTTPSSTEPMQETPPAPPSSFMDQQVLWPDMVQFSTMSDDQITQVLNQPGNVFEPSFGGGMSWEDMKSTQPCGDPPSPPHRATHDFSHAHICRTLSRYTDLSSHAVPGAGRGEDQ